MKILIAPGAFKHSMTADAAARAIAAGLRRSGLGAEPVLMPIADGGNSTLDVFLINGGERHTINVQDPLHRPTTADFGLLPDGTTAVIEMALASGLELLSDDERDPFRATTFGTGQLMQAALDAGAQRVIIGLGGSATVDGGAGCLQALGVKLLDVEGDPVFPGGGGLHDLAMIDTSGLDPRWAQTDVVIASDVDNPTLGEQGAAAVFGPQKGAKPEDVPVLEANLRHFFTLVREQVGVDVLSVPGGGAAGAFGAGLMAFVGGKMTPGIDLVLEHNRFDEQLADAALVITGEGAMDEQTVHGKGPIGVARRAREHGVPTIALVGGLNADDELLHDAGLQAVLPIVPAPMSLNEAIERGAELVERAALRLGYVLSATVK